MDKDKKKILLFLVRLTIGVFLTIYWYYYLMGAVPQSPMRVLVLAGFTFIFVISFFKGTIGKSNPKDSVADRPGGGGHEPY